jgi:hypothetical protein
MPADRPGHPVPRRRWHPHRAGRMRTAATRLPAAQQQAAEWWSLALHRFRDYLHLTTLAPPDAAGKDADDLDG